MKAATKARQALLASIIASATLASTGCSTGSGFTLASVNPFSKAAPPTSAAESEGVVTKFASTTKSAFNKTTGAVAGVFRSEETSDNGFAANDPLSLANKPAKVGPEVFVANGQLWESTGDLGKAMESYTKALESEANNPQALTNIARLHFRQGNHKMAAEFFKRAIAQQPDDAGLHNDLGLTLSKLDDYLGATQSLSKALAIAPGTSRYANNLASVRFEAGDVHSAFQVLANNNKPAVAHFNMAYLHFKSGQMIEARGHLNQALQSQPQAGNDTAVQRAVERSRDMLAQIDASMAPIAQAAPQATIAGGKYFNSGPPSPHIQQTSKLGGSNANVTPASSLAPSTQPATTAPAPAAATPPSSTPATSGPTAGVSTPTKSPSAWGFSLPKSATASRPNPIKPTESTTSETSPSSGDSSAPYSLPGGFTMPDTK